MSAYAQLRRQWREASEAYWRSITDPNSTHREAIAAELAALSVKLHFFEQAMRFARREAK